MGTGTLGHRSTDFGAPVGAVRCGAGGRRRGAAERSTFFLDRHPPTRIPPSPRIPLRLGDVLEVLEVLLQQLVHRGDVVLELGVHLLEL